MNETSINSLKRRALRRSKTLHRDTETGDVILPSKISLWFSKFKKPLTRAFWEDTLEKTENETLVDSKLLSYAYLEAGIIETIAWCVFFSYRKHIHLIRNATLYSLLAYFLVFYKNGFTPFDLKTAQTNGCSHPVLTSLDVFLKHLFVQQLTSLHQAHRIPILAAS